MTPLESWFAIGYVFVGLLIIFGAIQWCFPDRSDRDAQKRAAQVNAEIERRRRAFEVFDQPGRAERIFTIRAGRKS